MNSLLDFYKRSLRITAIGIGFFSAFIYRSLPSNISKFIVSGVVLGLLFIISEYLIRNKIWRLPFLYRRLDFNDKWLCITFYQDSSCSDYTFTSEPAYHSAKIRQDCQSIRIDPSPGDIFNNWSSVMMHLTESGGIAYTYDVQYTDGINAKGYEELNVLQRYPRIIGKPILLEGLFAHCAFGQSDPRRGRAVFCSKNMFSEITIESKMAEHIKQSIKHYQENRDE